VIWSLGEIGGQDAVDALIAALDSKSVDVRVNAILALQKTGARKARPQLRALLSDNERCHFGKLISVSEAARAALATLDAQ
jgi:FOG: HEAT repeat